MLFQKNCQEAFGGDCLLKYFVLKLTFYSKKREKSATLTGLKKQAITLTQELII